MKRLVEAWIDKDGCYRPEVDAWCWACIEPIWATGWESDLCPWCESRIDDLEFDRLQSEAGLTLRRQYHRPETRKRM